MSIVLMKGDNNALDAFRCWSCHHSDTGDGDIAEQLAHTAGLNGVHEPEEPESEVEEEL